MKLLFRVLLVVAVLVGVVVWAVRTHAPSGPRLWRPIAGGGEVRLYTITHGTQHTVSWGGPTWRERLQTAWQTQSLTPVLNQLSGQSVSAGSSAPSMLFWFELRGRPGGTLEVRDARLILPNGQSFRSYGGGGSSGGSSRRWGWLQHVNFTVLPAREKTLRFQGKLNGEPVDFDVPNPAYRADLPVWKSAPLPQSLTQGEVTLTLHSLGAKRNLAGQESIASAIPEWSMTVDGKSAHHWFSSRVRYEDPAGNSMYEAGLFSEPTWKLHAELRRTNSYPFTEADVQWLGTIDPKSAAGPQPGTFALLPVDSAAQTRGVTLAGVFGPGEYTIKDGVPAVADSSENRASDSPVRATWDHEKKATTLNLDRAAFVTNDQYGKDGVLIFRDAQGNPARLKQTWSHGGSGGQTVIYELPSSPIRFGVADSKPLSFEFFVRPPELPDAKESATPR